MVTYNLHFYEIRGIFILIMLHFKSIIDCLFCTFGVDSCVPRLGLLQFPSSLFKLKLGLKEFLEYCGKSAELSQLMQFSQQFQVEYLFTKSTDIKWHKRTTSQSQEEKMQKNVLFIISLALLLLYQKPLRQVTLKGTTKAFFCTVWKFK